MPIPSVSQLKKALKLAEKIELMEAELASILGRDSDSTKTRKSSGPTKTKRKMSPEARERIAAAQRKRWAAQKKTSKA